MNYRLRMFLVGLVTSLLMGGVAWAGFGPAQGGSGGGLGNVVLSGTPSSGQVPTATSATTATWQTPTSGGWSYSSPRITLSTITDNVCVGVSNSANNKFQAAGDAGKPNIELWCGPGGSVNLYSSSANSYISVYDGEQANVVTTGVATVEGDAGVDVKTNGVSRLKPNAVAKTLTSASAANLVQATVASDTTAGWHLSYTIDARDTSGHHVQSEHGIVSFTAVNANGTISTDVQVLGTPSHRVDTGTLTVVFDTTTGAGTATCRVTATTSLTTTTFRIIYTLTNDSFQAVAIQ